MASFVDGPVTVSVPATSANLGPGYDSLGLALDLRDRLTAEVAAGGLVVEVVGEGADDVPRDEQHLVVRAMRAAFTEMDARPPGLSLRCENVIPHARGLGSSSAAIVGGIALARSLVAGGSLLLDDDAVFRLAARLEGHPDNVAPAWYGGFVVCGREDGEFYAVPTAVDPRITTVVFVPPTAVSTAQARGLLPAAVPHADAAADAGRTALLVVALSGAPEHLLLATRDYLHQDYRRPAMPQSLALVDALRARGIPAVVSGAGPSVLAFCDGAGVEELVARAPAGWRAERRTPEHRGAVVE
ncbi:homoserine kinase [Nocardioides coralli]|uniref:homoserine kinase n=1 Tax=Nocardioides coralli TaxID=2872154 RepID=UPI001CA46AAE|nr:homoserine kinase [Nocardioides coralli]QZY30182.1 homoserine kinase [Nocardioides coralli]